MLPKILEVFATKKFTQYKRSRTLKIDSPEIPDNKNIGKLFSKYELLFLDQANSSSDTSQKWTLRFPTTRASLPLSPSLFKVQSTEIPLQHNPHNVLHWFPYLVLPHATTHRHNYWMYQTIWQAKPIKLIIKLYADHDTLWVKQITHQKAESLRAASLSKLDNTVNSNSIFHESMMNYLQNGRCSFIFTTLLMHSTTPTNSTKNPFLYFSQLSPPYSILTF